MGASLDRCAGFVDGTAIFIAHPGGGLQRACYSGHKRRHAVKFLNVLTPDGLFFYLYGPVEGRRHDITLYHESGLDGVLADAMTVNGEQFYLYADAAFMLRPWLQTAFEGLITPDQVAHNKSMNVPRTSVEWGFKDVKQMCSFLDSPSKMKLRETPVGLLYKAGALFWNLRCCAYGGATSTFFSCPPPTWSQYMGLPAAGVGSESDHPIDASRTDGPPFASSKGAIGGLPEPAGLTCVEYRDLPTALCHPGRDGKGGTSASAFARWAHASGGVEAGRVGWRVGGPEGRAWSARGRARPLRWGWCPSPPSGGRSRPL